MKLPFTDIHSLQCVPIDAGLFATLSAFASVLKFIPALCVCLSSAVAIRHSVLRPRWPCCCSVPLPSHPPSLQPTHHHPPTGRLLTLAGPDRELAWRGIHGAPRQPTEPTHSVCAGVRMPGQTHTHTHAYACMHSH